MVAMGGLEPPTPALLESIVKLDLSLNIVWWFYKALLMMKDF